MSIAIETWRLRPFFTIAGLMSRWKVSRSTINRAMENKTLKPTHIGSRVRFSAEEVERYERRER